MIGFEKAYTAWLDRHKAESRGERLRRLQKRFGYGEKLLLQQAWWPAVGNFDFLYPEYHFIDIHGKHYYIDLAYIRPPMPTALESDSFGSHVRDMDRDQHSRGLDRQNEIVLADWNIIRFSTDKLQEDALACQDVIRRLMVTDYGGESPIMRGLNIYQREIVRFASRSLAPFTLDEACIWLGKGKKQTRAQLYSLVELDLLEPVSGKARFHSYRFKHTLEL